MQRFNSLMLHDGDPPVQSAKEQIQPAACSPQLWEYISERFRSQSLELQEAQRGGPSGRAVVNKAFILLAA